MRVLIIGNGAREDALAWKISKSSRCRKLYVAPGNPGTARYAENVPIASDDLKGLLEFAKTCEIELTIVGPEVRFVSRKWNKYFWS